MKSLTCTSQPATKTRSPEAGPQFRLAYWVAALLLVSECVHLAMFAILGTTWHGPQSLRKPALFGISGGMTIWSLAWLMTQLRPQKLDPLLIKSLAIGLLIEVALITYQYWRGVAWHFNHYQWHKLPARVVSLITGWKPMPRWYSEIRYSPKCELRCLVV